MFTQLRPAIVSFLLLTVVTGVLYPAVVTGISKALFREKAEGSLIVRNDRVIGSELIGQAFASPKYFWSRPSATSPVPYNASAGSGSNLGPSNSALADAVKVRVAALQAADPGNNAPVPLDLVTASASGLDPHISPAAAEYQVNRVARARGISPDEVRKLVQSATESRTFNVLGEERVNVLRLNLALDHK